MKKIFTLLSIYLSVFSFSQMVQIYKDRADLVTQSNITTYNADLVAKGIRFVGSTNALKNNRLNNVATSDYIRQKLIDFGYPATDIQLQNISNDSTKPYYNVILTKTGTHATNKNTFVIMGAHFDSVNAGVGANDNLSGVAAVLETARILRTVSTEYSIKFIFFNSEEAGTYNGISGGLYGSNRYVSDVVLNGTPTNTTDDMKIKVMFNLDMVGGNNTLNNTTVNCEEDRLSGGNYGTNSTNNTASIAITNDLKNYVGYYSGITGVTSNIYSSDYMHFEYKGFVVTGLYERMTNSSGTVIDPNPTYHKDVDNASNISYPYLVQTTKAALGAMQHFAVADQSTAVLPTKEVTDFNGFKTYPNPAKEVLNIDVPNTNIYDIDLLDSAGRVVLKDKNKKQINTSKLKNGVYYLILRTENQSIYELVIIKN